MRYLIVKQPGVPYYDSLFQICHQAIAPMMIEEVTRSCLTMSTSPISKVAPLTMEKVSFWNIFHLFVACCVVFSLCLFYRRQTAMTFESQRILVGLFIICFIVPQPFALRYIPFSVLLNAAIFMFAYHKSR